MSTTERGALVWRGLMVTWAMITLVLLFALALLVYEMFNQGQQPFALSLPEVGEEEPEFVPTEATVTRDVQLYFIAPDGASLQTEQRRLNYSESTVANCRRALEALIEGPSSDAHTPLMSPQTRVRAVYLLPGGELVIDLTREAVQDLAGSATAEALMVYGLVNTLTQPGIQGGPEARVDRVRILIEGSPPQQVFSGHLDLSAPIGRDTSWVGSSQGDG